MNENKEYITHPDEMGCIHISEDVISAVAASCRVCIDVPPYCKLIYYFSLHRYTHLSQSLRRTTSTKKQKTAHKCGFPDFIPDVVASQHVTIYIYAIFVL